MAKCLELQIADKIVLKQQHFVSAAMGGPLKMLVGEGAVGHAPHIYFST